MPTQEELKSLLNYDDKTGIFTWRKSSGPVKSGSVAGYVNEKGYILIGIKGKSYRAHRLAWLYVTGEHPVNVIDHINGVRDDNRLSNLRSCTQKENINNPLARKKSSLTQPIGKSGVRGVMKYSQKVKNKHGYEDKTYHYYLAYIDTKGKRIQKSFPYTTEGLEMAKKWREEKEDIIYS